MVQGRENPPMTCRYRKVGIGEKSAGHRSIYKACDVGLIKQNPDDILDCQLRKVKILQALAVLRTLWSSRTEHVLKIQNASLDSVKYVNKFDKEIPQYFVCRMWFFNDMF